MVLCLEVLDEEHRRGTLVPPFLVRDVSNDDHSIFTNALSFITIVEASLDVNSVEIRTRPEASAENAPAYWLDLSSLPCPTKRFQKPFEGALQGC